MFAVKCLDNLLNHFSNYEFLIEAIIGYFIIHYFRLIFVFYDQKIL